MVDVYSIKEVKTRKPHICCSCNKTIPTGNMAQNAHGLATNEDGKITPYNFYVCQKCVDEVQIDEGEEAYKEHLDIWG